ncbi:MAG: 8-oxo-dGTP diphosphatase MutT [Clostridiales bacterium]|nr:8-oxo-dGTP diphosphatase MutT [Clostridiales bacterium]
MKTIEVAAAIIVKDNRIFATQRGYGEFKDGWEFPGGKIEPAESAQEALVREIREELDVDIRVGKLLETVEYDYPEFHLTMHCFICELLSEEIVLKEHEDARWLKKDELDSVPWLPADITIIEKIKAYMGQEENLEMA